MDNDNLIADLEEEGYVFRRDGIILGKDGFKMPDYLARDPTKVDLECSKRWTGKRSFTAALLIAKKYIPYPENFNIRGGGIYVSHRNGLKSDCSVDNLKWEVL